MKPKPVVHDNPSELCKALYRSNRLPYKQVNLLDKITAMNSFLCEYV